jgi:thiamine-monophosphate kinase
MVTRARPLGQRHMRMQEDAPIGSEAELIAMLAPLTEGAAGAFGLQDDCALLTPPEGCELVLKTDPVAQGVHFLADDAPDDIAWKALAVNVSDLAAKAARPLGYLMALAFPAAPRRAWVARFVGGLMAAQQRFGCALLGGDTDRRPGPLTVAITAIGSVPRGRMVRRTTARAGDRMFATGTLGDAALGLRLRRAPALADGWGLNGPEADQLRARFARPEPRLALAPALREHASAAMDISDGLAKDAARMCAGSACAGRITLACLPLSPACAKALAAEPTLIESVVSGGDDYELLAAVPPDAASAFCAAAAAAGVAVTEIGDFVAGSGLRLAGADGRPLALARTGWDHLA